MYKEVSKQLMSFIQQSPTAFHAVDTMKKILNQNGYQELSESQKWTIQLGGKYYVTRNQSSLIAFHVGQHLENYNFHIVASHSDSPTFKLKENAEVEIKNHYVSLNTEGYGGMICASWLDRPLSIAGRVMVKDNNTYQTRLLCFDQDLVLIPNVAIHMNRSVNDGYAYNKQIDMLPLIGGQAYQSGDLKKMIAKELQVDVEDIYGSDLYLYNRMQPTIWGAHDEFISSPRLDDLQCAYTSLQGFLKGHHSQTIQVFACFDNEEVGSSTKQGAASTFLYDTLYRIHHHLFQNDEDFYRAVASSFMLSGDNAHAVHPNHPEKTDQQNGVYMNQGIVVKSHAGQKYTSDALSIAVLKDLCEKAGVSLQFFANRSDMLGGSTLGNIAMSQVSMNCVDIGLAQLAMHSSYETAGIKDSYDMIKVMEEFYNSHIQVVKDGYVIVDKEG